MYIHSFKNGNDNPTRNSFISHYIPLLEIKDFNALIDDKSFSDQPVKNKQQACEKIVELSRNSDYTTGNLLDYLYHQKYYKLISIDLSRQKNAIIRRQISFIGKLEENDGAAMFLYC